jgi:hypothetical protein
MTDAAKPQLVWTPHPLLPALSEEQINAVLEAGKVDELAAYYQEREKLIRLSEDDPFDYGLEPDHWQDADKLRAMEILFLIIFGGNRAGKSEYAAKRIVQDAMKFPDSVLFCFHENEKASIGLQQKYIYRYLPKHIKALEGKTNPVYKIKYTQANGFTDGKLVLPNRSEIYFLTYHQKPSDFEGLELGAKHERGRLGGWADESLTLPWFNMLKLRLASRSAKLIWTFTPVSGITPVIKEVLGGTPKVVESRFAELLADRVNVPGLPVGHMPYVVEPFMAKARVIYFHSILNPFGNHYPNIKSLCAGRPSEYVERRAYGYARDVATRALPYFGPWNVVKPDQLPREGTNYMFVDPAGARNWATIWVRVAPGNPPLFYVYRDWPSEQQYGEWAVPTERDVSDTQRRGWDGDPGPAQNTFGWGAKKYKQVWLEQERVTVRVLDGQIPEKDPYRRALVEEQLRELGYTITEATLETHGWVLDMQGQVVKSIPVAQQTSVQEQITGRYIDPRAGKNQIVSADGSTCIIKLLFEEDRDAGGRVVGPPMRVHQASGVSEEEGLTAINELLFWNKDEPHVPLINEPQLYVSEECRQVIWAMQNYTGQGGATGACKDFIDLLRYMALARLGHRAYGRQPGHGGGSY